MEPLFIASTTVLPALFAGFASARWLLYGSFMSYGATALVMFFLGGVGFKLAWKILGFTPDLTPRIATRPAAR